MSPAFFRHISRPPAKAATEPMPHHFDPVL